MKKILFISILIAGIFIAGCSQQKDNLNLEIKCSELAQIAFQNYNKVYADDGKGNIYILNYKYQNFYNKKDNKCYLLINGYGENAYDKVLLDVYENRTMAECKDYYLGYMKDDVLTCNFNKKEGNLNYLDVDKFDTYVNKYME